MLHKFPSTPHLAWLGKNHLREDKVLADLERDRFLSNPLIIEEKIDGANLGLSFSAEGQLQFQNRGNWLTGCLQGQWQRLRGWAATHEQALRENLPPQHVLFGEWCYAKHSSFYDHLPDWFIAFDVFDSEAARFWSTPRRNKLLANVGIPSVPEINRGRFSLSNLIVMLDGTSGFGGTFREGIYLRRESEDWLLERVKLVRPEFVQSINEHWSKGALMPNCVVAGRDGRHNSR